MVSERLAVDSAASKQQSRGAVPVLQRKFYYIAREEGRIWSKAVFRSCGRSYSGYAINRYTIRRDDVLVCVVGFLGWQNGRSSFVSNFEININLCALWVQSFNVMLTTTNNIARL